MSRSTAHVKEVAVSSVFIGGALIIVIRQIHVESARISVTRRKVADVHPDADASQIDVAAGELQCGDGTVRGHFPGGAFVYGNIRGRARSGHGRFTGPSSSVFERNVGRAAPVVEVTGPKTSSVESNARSASLVAEVTVLPVG